MGGLLKFLLGVKAGFNVLNFQKERGELLKQMSFKGIKPGTPIKKKVESEWLFGKIIFENDFPKVQFKDKGNIIRKEHWTPSWIKA